MKIIKDLIIKNGIGIVGLVGTGWGLKIALDKRKKADLLSKVQNVKVELGKTREQMPDDQLEIIKQNTKDQIKALNLKEAAEEQKAALDYYNANSSNSIANDKLILANEKLSKAVDEILNKDIGSFITDLFNKYQEYLLTLTPDKILAIYNIILNGMLFSSFISVLSIMLSENVINRMTFLVKYPRILKLLKLRNNINRKVSLIFLAFHLFLIVIGVLSNI
jgi:hypothetical protein